MRGIVERVLDGHGFIRGDNGVGYFFLPTALQMMCPIRFDDIEVGMVAEFVPITHPRGERAIEVFISGVQQTRRRRTNPNPLQITIRGRER